MTAWFGFFQSSAEVCATLLGLLVVAISINLGRILETPHLPDRAGGALIPIAGVLVVSMLAQVPGQPVRLLGGEMLTSGVILALVHARALSRSLPHYRKVRRAWLWSRIFLTQGQAIPALIAGVTLLCGAPSGLYWAVGAVIFTLVAAVANAWVLLVEIVR